LLRGIFVTGTDTNIGKTVVAAALMRRYRRDLRLRYWKPIQTGIERDDDTREVQRLAACRPRDVLKDGIRLRRPLSPHLSAELADVTIELKPLVNMLADEDSSTRWIVEGAGGALVPINGAELMTDLMVRLALPVIVVARSGLGTINHTLLTLEALRARSLVVSGVVMVGSSNAGNCRAIESYGGVRVLGQMPRFARLTPKAVARWAAKELDPEKLLLEWIR
jgi:dethiobiotin synthase